MNPSSELRLLTATEFDSRVILSVVLAGDARLDDKLRRDILLPLGSRIRGDIVELAATEFQLGNISDTEIDGEHGFAEVH